MKTKTLLFSFCMAMGTQAFASSDGLPVENNDISRQNGQEKELTVDRRKPRLTIGGYGEAVYSLSLIHISEPTRPY